MAQVIIKSGNFISVTGIDKDIPLSMLIPAHTGDDIRIKRIEFSAATEDDLVVIKNGADDAAVICQLGSPEIPAPDRVYFDDGGQYMQPFVDLSACTLIAAHILIFELA